MGSCVIMPVSNRIKILECKSITEVENKVNDFLAFDEDIVQLVAIDYRLEFNIVIIEYVVLDDETNNKIRMIIKDEIKDGLDDYSSVSSLYDYNYSGNPFVTSWLKLCFPFYYNHHQD